MSAGQEIYEARLGGALWSVAIHRAGLPLMAGLIVAREYADTNGLSWPPVKGQANSTAHDWASTNDLADMAKKLFKPVWEPEPKPEPDPKRTLEGHYLRLLPTTVGWRAYIERILTRHTWSRITSRIRPENRTVWNGSYASQAAQRVASTWKLPWPVPDADWVPPEDLNKQAEAYRLRKLSFPWEVIMLLTGFKHKNSARMGAFYHARKFDLPWPLQAPPLKVLASPPTTSPLSPERAISSPDGLPEPPQLSLP